MVSQGKSKFAIACVRMILGKVRVEGLTGQRRETNVRYEFGFKKNLKNLGCK